MCEDNVHCTAYTCFVQICVLHSPHLFYASVNCTAQPMPILYKYSVHCTAFTCFVQICVLHSPHLLYSSVNCTAQPTPILYKYSVHCTAYLCSFSLLLFLNFSKSFVFVYPFFSPVSLCWLILSAEIPVVFLARSCF
jgi:hypothetical protein